MLNVNENAPDFTLPDQDNIPHALSDYRGQWVLVYFYPKDNTPGCTTEACSIRDAFPRFDQSHIKVFGISTDTPASHKKFAEKYQLPFTLLADPKKKVVTLYNVYGTKTLFGKKIPGTKRASFLINPEGVIAKIYTTVKPAEHAKQVLQDVKETRPL